VNQLMIGIAILSC